MQSQNLLLLPARRRVQLGIRARLRDKCVRPHPPPLFVRRLRTYSFYLFWGFPGVPIDSDYRPRPLLVFVRRLRTYSLYRFFGFPGLPIDSDYRLRPLLVFVRRLRTYSLYLVLGFPGYPLTPPIDTTTPLFLCAGGGLGACISFWVFWKHPLSQL